MCEDSPITIRRKKCIEIAEEIYEKYGDRLDAMEWCKVERYIKIFKSEVRGNPC